jgi:hypothetical protein
VALAVRVAGLAVSGFDHDLLCDYESVSTGFGYGRSVQMKRGSQPANEASGNATAQSRVVGRRLGGQDLHFLSKANPLSEPKPQSLTRRSAIGALSE